MWTSSCQHHILLLLINVLKKTPSKKWNDPMSSLGRATSKGSCMPFLAACHFYFLAFSYSIVGNISLNWGNFSAFIPADLDTESQWVCHFCYVLQQKHYDKSEQDQETIFYILTINNYVTDMIKRKNYVKMTSKNKHIGNRLQIYIICCSRLRLVLENDEKLV